MIEVPRYSAIELDTGEHVSGYYYMENGYWIDNGKPDLNRPVQRHYIVDVSGKHRDIAEDTLAIACV